MSPSKKDRELEDICSPIFDAEMGARLALARKKRIYSQTELALKLGIQQSTLSDLETGRIPVPRHPFTVAKLREIFEDDTDFILYAYGAARFNAWAIGREFHQAKMVVGRRRVKREHWTHEACRRDYPRRQS